MEELHLQTIGPSGDCAVLKVTGEIDIYTGPMLRERIQDLAAKGAVHIIADMSRVDFLDSPAWESSSAASNDSANTTDPSHRSSARRVFSVFPRDHRAHQGFPP